MPKPKQPYSHAEDWKSLWEPDLEAIAYNGHTCDPTRMDSKVLQWAKRNCSHTPHFIKIINRNAAHGRPGLKSSVRNASCCHLAVPTAFVRKHFRELQRVVTLENDEGKTWRVSFLVFPKADSTIRTIQARWHQGWRRVTADNDFKPGEVIVFVLVADSRFHFTRFDENGNLISAVKKEFTTVTNLEESQHRRTSWKSKPTVGLTSRIDRCAQPSGLGFDGHGHVEGPQLSAPADKDNSARVSDKRRSLRRVGLRWKRSSPERTPAMNKICQ